MQVMQQDETYNEEDYGFEESEEAEYAESEEETESQLTHIAGIPKMTFIAIVVGVVLVLVLAFVLTTRGGKDNEETVEPEFNTETLADTTVTETPPVVVSTELYDSTGTLMGTVESLSDGMYVYDADGFFIGTYYASTGTTPVYDSMLTQIGTMTPWEETSVNTETSSIDIATSEQLRRAGYTGDEIELALSMGTSVDELLLKAQEVQDEAAKEALIRMSDTASPEFQERTQNTMYCMPLNTFESFTLDADTATNYQGSYIVNADFEKMPTYGLQLQLKCKIADGTYVFYTVTPAQWETLPETGNIVLHVDYVLYGTYGINVWITGITEMNVSDITVNPEDSAARLQDIVNLPTAEEVVE